MDRKLKIFIFTILFFIFFYKIFFGYGFLDGDLLDEYLPKLTLLKNSLSAFKFPLYEKSFGLGFPIYKDIQNSFYYPLNWLVFLPFDIFITVNFLILLNVIIFFFGVYKLLYKLKIKKDYSFLLSVIFTFSSFFVSHIPHYTILTSLSISPLTLYFLINFFENRKRKNFILSVLFFLLVLIGGHPQIFFYTVFLSFFIFLTKYRSTKNFLYLFMIIFFSTFLSLFVLMPTLNLFKYSYRVRLQYNILPLKYLILSIFPDLFGGVSPIFKSSYNGLFNINETSFYFSMIFFFSFNYFLFATFFKKKFRNFRKILIPIFFLLLSFFDLFGIKIFLTPTRSLYLFITTFIFSFALDMFENIDEKFIIFNVFVFGLLLTLILMKGFGYERYIVQIIFFVIYSLFFYLMLKKVFTERMKFVLLVFITFFDIFLSTGGILKYDRLKSIKNYPYDFLKDKYVITYIPENVLFYKNYIKDYFKTDNLETLKRYSTFGNRGVYYNCYSFNLYQNFTFKKYVEFFDDQMIMQGGFSNINFLFNPLTLNYDYLFVPDIPIILNVKDFIRIDFKDGFSDTLIIFYTGDFKDVKDYRVEEEYLKNVKDLKSGLVYIDGSLRIFGNGTIYMVKSFKDGKILHFPYLFENSNFEKISEKPFYLFKKKDSLKEPYFITNPVDGSFVEKDRTFIPLDLFMGIFISVISFLVMLFYSKKEFENV
ncbi:MAG: transmembrane(s)proteins 12..29 [candidate division TA06 bacterium 32_111]|uniref:Transmembrane(S)proteins 12..29 n=2 Tax=Bacteria candidate phyla TaxID=1783234 RepID=A0A117M6J3_UNCT6|nr:MAG: transmembrane(s)proteins 12..29 [candidate division TA06 bacterium 32_111]KUK87144.1 MAG: transmembrane(s)proteins 12..29 [candidate division TA06 bacterium 34_109]HAF06843.1 hypothetical protein [candidate division WOR-3 bacterium]